MKNMRTVKPFTGVSFFFVIVWTVSTLPVISDALPGCSAAFWVRYVVCGGMGVAGSAPGFFCSSERERGGW